jgi:hypothetical protein
VSGDGRVGATTTASAQSAAPVDVVMADALATRARYAEVRIDTPAVFLKPEATAEDFLREVNGRDRGEAFGVVTYVVIDGRRLRVTVRDLDGPTAKREPSCFKHPTAGSKTVAWKGKEPPLRPVLTGFAFASQDPERTARP